VQYRNDQSADKRGDEKVLRTLLVIVVGLLPSLFSLWVMRKTHLRTRTRLRQAAMNLSRTRIRPNVTPLEGDRYYLEGVGYLVGDISCQFNARSGYVRCAVNPSGPCQGCRHYEPRELASSEKQV
jgi:hypothetical protein